MSAESPDTPRRPLSRASSRSTRSTSMSGCRKRCSTAPGSRLPHRVPIIRPSSAVKPIDVATLRPPCSAHRLAPLPRCASSTRSSSRISVSCSTTDSYANPWKPYRRTPAMFNARGSANQVSTVGRSAWKAVSKHPTWRTWRQRAATTSTPCRLARWCIGASAIHCAKSFITWVSSSTGARYCGLRARSGDRWWSSASRAGAPRRAQAAR